ncbi:MAG: class I SAM-dependent methyltransferase [Chitinophagaceae bacterium]
MEKNLPFDSHVAEYDAWFDHHPGIFQSELAAIKQQWPVKDNIVSLEIGAATGRFAKELNITEGIEPSINMASVAKERGVSIWRGKAESLPYGDLEFDVVLMNDCISYLDKPDRSIIEAYKVLRYGGSLLIGFIVKGSLIGNYYESNHNDSVFYQDARFFSVNEVEEMVKAAGFKHLSFTQTLFNSYEQSTDTESVLAGCNKGSYVLLKALKPVLG